MFANSSYILILRLFWKSLVIYNNLLYLFCIYKYNYCIIEGYNNALHTNFLLNYFKIIIVGLK